MAYTITIKFEAVAAPNTAKVAQICGVYYPDTAAANLPVFEGTYYDTNVEGIGELTTLEAYLGKMVAHPGLIAALRLAVQDGEAVFETEDDKAYLLMNEASKALVSEGFTITIEKN